MDLRIRTTLIAVILIFAALVPVHAQDQEYEIQFGVFLIQDNAQRVKKDLLETVPDVYVKKIDTENNRHLYSVRFGPFPDQGTAISRMEALKRQDPYLRASVVEVVVPVAETEPEQPIAAETVFAAQEPPPETAPVTDSVTEEPPSETILLSEDTPVETVVAGESIVNPPVQKEATLSVSEPETESETEPAWDETGTDSVWGQEETSDNQGVMPSGSDSITSDAATPLAATPAMNELKAEVDELKAQVKTMLDAEEIRGTLAEQEEEKADRSEDILDAAGRNYTLMKKGGFGFEYKLDYTYYAYDSITEINVIEHNSNHTLTNTFTIEYPMRDNLTLEAAIPFVYEFDAVGRDDSKHVTDFGDVRFGASFQPIKSGGKIPSIILNTSLTCPMGRSPYEVNPDLDLSTGSGGYSLEGSLSMSKVIDPIMVFGTLSYDYKFPIKGLDYKIGSYTLERYDRGDAIGISVGLGYSVSYITSVTLGYSYSYSLKSRRYYQETAMQEYPTQTSSSLSIGSSWRLTSKLRANVNLGIGLGNSDYFSLSCRLPMEFGRD